MFSVIIPVHNKLPHLDRSVNSVLNQSYKDFELILIDDASSDGSERRIYEYQDPRIHRYSREHPGPGGYAGRNLGIENAKRSWIAFLDADDEWHPDYLLERVTLLKKYDGADIISSKYSRKTEGARQTINEVKGYSALYTEFQLTDFLEKSGLMWTGSVTIKKTLLLDAGMFPVGKCKRGGDLDTWIRCLYKSKQSLFINKNLSIYYRDTVNQVTDHSKNPSTVFCSAETLNLIRNENKENKLLNAIDRFVSRHVYNILKRTRNIDSKYKKYLLSLIHSKNKRIELAVKLSLMTVLQKLKIK